MIAFACPQCAKPYRLKPEFAGRTTQCSGCKAPLVVPQEDTPARIAFNCDSCGMKFRVPPECAGRKTTCPTCKQPLVVPRVEQTLADTPAMGQIHGVPSSLAHAGVDGGVSLTADTGNAAPAWQHLLDGKVNNGVRYVVESEIARGGMGVVMRAVDCDIRREVAVKYLLDQADAGKKLRFVEEAQITGQLEHPNIVPIHELGVDAQKRIFFAMKMVKGRSLAQILTALREEPKSAEKDYPLGKLLNIFVNSCNALAYAHARGVVHRDLKPANIMVGDFGEVYVMDWGLAKVLKHGVPTASPVMAVPVARFVDATGAAFAADDAPAVMTVPVARFADADDGTPTLPVATTPPSSGATQVVTSRESDADLTQDGAVVGTPVYMPPEQAAGHLADIDERSDVYSMGAILYELLTLQPPISKEGGYWPIRLRVTQGQITPPELKDPQRTREGKVPSELAAVAMKALAKRKEDRYPGVDRLCQDVECFMEGRSVSAKTDTVRELAVKLVKRNRGASVATAAAAVVLAVVAIWSLTAILRANARTRVEAQAKHEQAKQAVPSFVRAAKLLVAERQFDDALAQVHTALSIEPEEADARLLRALLLLTQQDYAGAQIDLKTHQRLRPDHAQTQVLLNLLRKARVDDKVTLLALADALNRQGAYVFVDRVLQGANRLMVSRQEALERYCQRLEAAWPGAGPRMTLNVAGEFELNLRDMDIKDIEPLRGLPLVRLDLTACSKVADLGPLQGMPLTFLNLSQTRVNSLVSLKGLALVELHLFGTQVNDLTPLADMPLKTLGIAACGQLTDLSPVQSVPLTSLDASGCPQLDLAQLKGLKLTSLNVHGSLTTDLSPLQGMPLADLYLRDCSKVNDLTPLQGMPLIRLTLTGCSAVSDLTPLQDMPLTHLSLGDCVKVSDLTPLKGMPLVSLDINGCGKVTDLTPLQGMPLTGLVLNGCVKVTDLTPLKGMPLATLHCLTGRVADLTPLKGMPLTTLAVTLGKVADLAPIKGMPLGTLHIDGGAFSDLTPLQGMPLSWLMLHRCGVLSNLKALTGMPLTNLELLDCAKVSDVAPLKGLKLTHLGIEGCPVTDLAPLAGMRLQFLHLKKCRELHDLTPLQGMPLSQIWLPPEVAKGLDVIRGMQTLGYVDGIAPAALFWQQWDAAKEQAK